MIQPRRVAKAPSRPVMLYDEDCRFCVLWIKRWRQCTGDAVEYRPLQDESVPKQYPELSREDLSQAVHLINMDGTVSVGADAAVAPCDECDFAF